MSWVSDTSTTVLNLNVELQKWVQTKDSNGRVDESWVKVADIRAKVDSNITNRLVIADRFSDKTDISFLVNYKKIYVTDTISDYAIVRTKAGVKKRYRIKDYENIDDKNCIIKLLVENDKVEVVA